MGSCKDIVVLILFLVGVDLGVVTRGITGENNKYRLTDITGINIEYCLTDIIGINN